MKPATTETGTTVGRTTLGDRLTTSRLGLGCMGMAEFYGDRDEDESIRTIRAAIDTGMDFLDTAAMYGSGLSEEIVGRALAGGRRADVTLATKGGLLRVPSGVEVNGRPEHLAKSIDESLTRLATDHVDLYYLHRVDPEVPIEDSVGAMAELVSAGKVCHLGLSEANAATVRRAAAVAPIAAVQSEYSLATRKPETTLFPTLQELNIGFVAYGPFSRGLLSGEVTNAPGNLRDDDMRRGLPRFQDGNLAHNAGLVARLEHVARSIGCTQAQLALAWVMSRGVVPIPGANNRRHMLDNAGADAVELSDADLAAIDAIVPPGAFRGERFPEHLMALVQDD
jgi:aryl-alcohol dehydrogenase-like predicted oxidoreductase